MRYKNDLIDALLKEVDLVSAKPLEPVETIYFGGGTPSLCTTDEIKSIIEKVKQNFNVLPSAEITLEANPDDINADLLDGWRTAGVNRLSIGIQSFFEEDLTWMNRAHNASQALQSLKLARSKFDNITMDLIYGTPALTDEKWKSNVETAVALDIPHLSCYALTVEPKTPLQKMIRQHQSPDIDPDRQSSQFLLLMDWMRAAGYEHYEISNFAKPGYRSRHNSSYWRGNQYLGLGPSAHSFDGKSRWWNVSNNSLYIQAISEGRIPSEKEVLTPEQQMNERIMISLRTVEGFATSAILDPSSDLDKKLASELFKDVEIKSRKYISEGLMKEEAGFLRLTDKGKLFADGIAADLFI